ncbi:hypothetical protein F443_22956 [Phytophthora nicotianae P1569]|nr:hypothetical protein F443_22956 [Phytophthora nicotianae P1569]
MNEGSEAEREALKTWNYQLTLHLLKFRSRPGLIAYTWH